MLRLYVLTKNKPSTQRLQNQSMYSHWFCSFFPKCAWPRFGILSPWNWNGLSQQPIYLSDLLVRLPSGSTSNSADDAPARFPKSSSAHPMRMSQTLDDPSKLPRFSMALTPPLSSIFLRKNWGEIDKNTLHAAGQMIIQICMLTIGLAIQTQLRTKTQVRICSNNLASWSPEKDLGFSEAPHVPTIQDGDSKHGCFLKLGELYGDFCAPCCCWFLILI